MEWVIPKWITKKITKEVVEVKIVPYFFTAEAQAYQEEIRHLEKLLKQSDAARKVAEEAARKNLYPDAEFAKALNALRILRRVKMEIDLWTGN